VNDEEQRAVRGPSIRTVRMEAFSDGVFAIAITLLVLEISVPPGAHEDLLKALIEEWPSYLAYLVSFSTIGAVWFVHTVITEYLHRATSVLIRLNLLLLLVLSFLPFPTQLLAEAVREGGSERVATTVYGINLLLTSVVVSLLWRYAVRERLVRPDARDEDVKAITKRLTPGLTGYLLMILLGLFLPLVAVVGYLAIAIYIIVPIRALRHRAPRRPRTRRARR
jgi:uncharacterized membrane protein